MFKGDATDFYRLAGDLTDVAAEAVPALRSGMAEAGRAVERSWRNNAARTHTGHAKHFPESITSELVFSLGSVVVDVGPNQGAANQGFLGRILEFGGSHSPAYLHGAKALADNEGRVERIVDQALRPLFP